MSLSSLTTLTEIREGRRSFEGVNAVRSEAGELSDRNPTLKGLRFFSNPLQVNSRRRHNSTPEVTGRVER